MGQPETFWLTVMNVALGVAVLAFGLGIGLAAAREWMRHRAHRRHEPRAAAPRSGW